MTAPREHADASRKLLLAAAAVVGLAASFAAGHVLGAGAVRGGDDRAEQVRRQVLAELALHYYEPLPDSLPSEGSVARLVAALGDPHTRYLPPRAYRALARAENAEHGGIGVRVRRDRAGRGLLVTRVLAGLPAARVGVRAGDVITGIDGRPLRDLAHRERLELLAGPVGAGIRVQLARRGRDPRAISLVRRALTAPPLESRTLAGADGRYLVVRVAGFAARAARAVHVLARRAAAQRYAGIVIDVRGNPGGLLAEGVAAVQSPRGGFMTNWAYIYGAALEAVESRALEREVLDDIAWARWPQVDAGLASRPPLGGIDLGISAFTRHPELAVEAVRCLTTADSQRRYMLKSKNPAARAAVYDDAEVRRVFPMADLIRDSIADAAPRAKTPYYTDVSAAVQRTFHPPAAVSPDRTPAAADRLIVGVLHDRVLL